jgi:hypothetical protein
LPDKLDELTTDTLIEEGLRIHQVEQTVQSFRVLVDIWKVKQNVLDESNMDKDIDLSELIDYANSKYDVKIKSNGKFEEVIQDGSE